MATSPHRPAVSTPHSSSPPSPRIHQVARQLTFGASPTPPLVPTSASTRLSGSGNGTPGRRRSGSGVASRRSSGSAPSSPSILGPLPVIPPAVLEMVRALDDQTSEKIAAVESEVASLKLKIEGLEEDFKNLSCSRGELGKAMGQMYSDLKQEIAGMKKNQESSDAAVQRLEDGVVFSPLMSTYVYELVSRVDKVTESLRWVLLRVESIERNQCCDLQTLASLRECVRLLLTYGAQPEGKPPGMRRDSREFDNGGLLQSILSWKYFLIADPTSKRETIVLNSLLPYRVNLHSRECLGLLSDS